MPQSKKKRQPDWITTEILDLMKKRNKCKINGNMDRYKFLRNKVSALINISKRKMYQVQIEESKENPRSIWKLFRKFGASCKNQPTENIIGVKSQR